MGRGGIRDHLAGGYEHIVDHSARALTIQAPERFTPTRAERVEGQQRVRLAPAHAGASGERSASQGAVRDDLSAPLPEAGLIEM